MNTFHYLPDEILYKIFSFVEDELVDCLEDEFPGWKRFKNDFIEQSEKDQNQCEALIPRDIILNYTRNFNLKHQYTCWHKILKGFSRLTRNTPWRVEKEELMTLFGYEHSIYELFGQKLYYMTCQHQKGGGDIKKVYYLKSYDIFSKENIDTGVIMTSYAVNNHNAIIFAPKFEYSSGVIAHFVYFCGIKKKLICVKLCDEDTFVVPGPEPDKMCNINNVLFILPCSRDDIHLFRITEEQILKEKVLNFNEKIRDINSRNQDLIILTTTKIIIWNDQNIVKEMSIVGIELPIYSCYISFFEDEIILSDLLPNTFHRVQELQEESSCILQHLGTFLNRRSFVTFLKTGYVIIRNDNSGELELRKPEHTLRDVINNPTVKFSETLFPHLEGWRDAYYINNAIYIIYQDKNEKFLYKFSK